MSLTGQASGAVASPDWTAFWPAATMSSTVAGASGARSVLRISTMLFIVNGMP